MDLGKPVREIEVSPEREPVPQPEIAPEPETTPAELPDKIPA